MQVFILDHTSQVQIDDCINCKIFIGKRTSSLIWAPSPSYPLIWTSSATECGSHREMLRASQSLGAYNAVCTCGRFLLLVAYLDASSHS